MPLRRHAGCSDACADDCRRCSNAPRALDAPMGGTRAKPLLPFQARKQRSQNVRPVFGDAAVLVRSRFPHVRVPKPPGCAQGQ